MKLGTILLLVLLNSTSILTGNILYISGIPSPSHHIWHRTLAFALANKGHNVTFLGTDADKDTPANYSYILMEGLYDAFHSDFDMFDMADFTPTQMIHELINFALTVCEATVKTLGLQQLLNYPENFRFDGIVIDVTIGTCLYPLFQRFGFPPIVGVTPFMLPTYLVFTYDGSLHPSYIPWYRVPYSNSMSFKERFLNTLYVYGEIIWRKWSLDKAEQEMSSKIFGNNIPSNIELERNISLLLSNSDPILNYPQPIAPNIIPVGGLHIYNGKKLPKEFRKLLDSAKNGVVVFSLGTNVRSDKLTLNIRRALLSAFSKLEETVIWKFESDLDNLPDNVVIKHWLPQNEVLAHPKVKLFIGHGGALSTQEAIFHGVPMICVPFIFDQPVNCRSIAHQKLGLSLNYHTISEKSFFANIREALDNPIYMKNMKQASIRIRDTLETPLERAIFWVEYIMRHGDAQFLNTQGRDLPFYKSSGLDVLGFLVGISSIVLISFYKFLKLLLSQVYRKNKQKSE